MTGNDASTNVEMGTLNVLHEEDCVRKREISIASISQQITEHKDEYGKKLIKKLTKVKDFELEGKYVNYFLLLIVGFTAAMFATFLWYFLYETCSPQVKVIEPFWSNAVYASNFNNPQSGLHVCQSFIQASKIQCATVSDRTLSPSAFATHAPTQAPISNTSIDEASTFCLVPCVLPGFDCDKDYDNFNKDACQAAVSSELSTFYGSNTGFSCGEASAVNCAYQAIPNTQDFYYGAGSPSTISVVFITCTTVGQAILNSV